MTKKTNKTKSRWTVKVEKDDFSKDYYIVFPDELIEKLNWKVDDTLAMEYIWPIITIKNTALDVNLKITKKHEQKNTKAD